MLCANLPAKLNLVPITYPWAWQQFQDMSANFWTPKQRTLGEDRTNYSFLTGKNVPLNIKEQKENQEQHMFRYSLAYLTTSDIQIGDNAEDGVSEFLHALELSKAPEIRCCISTQAFFERIHAWSYQHILETILSLSEEEQKELYNLWQTEPTMWAKVEFAHRQSLTLADPFERIYRRTAAFFFYYMINEGGWFMGGFNPLFAFNNRDGVSFTGLTDNLIYIKRDESAHVKFGYSVLKYIQANMPGIWHRTVQEFITPLIHECTKLEDNWADFLIQDGILGYNTRIHKRHFRHLMNLRCTSLEIEIPFPEIEKTPLSWLSKYELKMETSFFERHTTEYSSGGLNWYEKDEAGGSIIDPKQEK